MHLLKRNIRWDGARYTRQSRASGMKRLRKPATHPSIFNPAMDWINIFAVYANAKLFLFGGLFGDFFFYFSYTYTCIEKGRQGCSTKLLYFASHEDVKLFLFYHRD